MTPEEICSELSTLLEKANKEGPEGTSILCSVIIPLEHDDEKDLAFGFIAGDQGCLETAIMMLMEKNSEIFTRAVQGYAIRRMSMVFVPTNNKSIFGGSNEDHGN
jgi:hypothetical protein